MTTQSCLGRVANLLVLYAPRSFSSVLRLVASFRPNAAGPLGPRSLCRFLLLNPSATSLYKKNLAEDPASSIFTPSVFAFQSALPPSSHSFSLRVLICAWVHFSPTATADIVYHVQIPFLESFCSAFARLHGFRVRVLCGWDPPLFANCGFIVCGAAYSSKMEYRKSFGAASTFLFSAF